MKEYVVIARGYIKIEVSASRLEKAAGEASYIPINRWEPEDDFTIIKVMEKGEEE